MIYITRPKLPSLIEYNNYLKKIWKNNVVTNNGEFLIKLEKFFKKKFNNNNIELVANGTLALQIAIKVLKIQGEVITTPYTYVATSNSLKWQNCSPVFVDINEDDFCINADLIEEKINKRTTAILATHVYGLPCNIEKINKIVKKYNLKIIYDAAHTFGVNYKKLPLFINGDASALSLHATKNFHTVEGGAIYMKKKNDITKVNLSKKFGHEGELKYFDVGINAKMSEFHAAMGLASIKNIDLAKIKKKNIFNNYYNEFFQKKNIQLMRLSKDIEYNYAYFPIIFKNKNVMMRIQSELKKYNIFARRYFFPSLDTLKFLNHDNKYHCPVSRDISSRVLCLPLYQDLEVKMQNKIIKIINTCLLNL
jgi:dTDP-4-amino-4,6-dideoxygalactose transaminase